MMWSTKVCPCGGTYERHVVEVRLQEPGSDGPILMEGIPQAVCPDCGSLAYQVSDLVMIETVHKSSPTT